MPPETQDQSTPAATATDVYIRVVLGSTTPPGRLHRAIEGAIERADCPADLLDLGTLRLGFADGTPAEDLDDDTAATLAALESAPALILATPIYRGSLTGSLKNLLDLTPVPALQGKTIGLVAMGASDHHFLGAERHLRDVLAFFGALVTPVAVYLNGGDFEDGAPTERAETLLDELFAGVAATSAALEGVEELRAPTPLAARAIKPRPAKAGA